MEIKISAQHFLDVTKGMNNKNPFGYVGEQNFIIMFSEVKPIDGYKIPVNEKTGKKLPFCCNFHSKLFYGITKWYDKEFPNCCNNHKMLAANPQFKKTDYKSVAEKVVNQLSYTEHVIRMNIDNTDWYKDITDYIEYNTFSFGHPVSVGNNYYLNNVLALLEDVKFFEGMDDNKKIALINFVKSYFEPFEKVEGTDLNLLHSTYQDWLNTFPFDLSFFENLKPYFEKQFPILKGKAESNKYLGTVRLKLHTKESLIIHLLSVTDSIIKQINTYILYQKGLLKEPEKIKLEIILSERKLELKNGYLPNTENDSRQFENVLNKWFEHEKRFIDEITPLLKAIPAQEIEEKDDKNEINKIKYITKHYVLAYIFDCKTNGENLPYGNKKEIEKIGNERMGRGKGNTFYKNYNIIINKDFNVLQNLIEIAGENWRGIILKLSKNHEKLEKYLQSKKI